MGFVSAAIGLGSAVVGAFTASSARKGAKRSAAVLAGAADTAITSQREAEERALERSRVAEERARADFEPFTAAGTRAIGGLEEGLAGVSRLVTDPEAQREFITNNPFFDALATRATEELFSNQAARGKVGSGGTAEALQNSLVLLGSSLLNQNVTQRQNVNTQFQNLVNIGQVSAAGQAGVTGAAAGRDVDIITGTAADVARTQLQKGSAQAAGIKGAQEARIRGINTAINTGLAIAGLPQFNRGGGGVGDEFVPVPVRRPTQL